MRRIPAIVAFSGAVLLASTLSAQAAGPAPKDTWAAGQIVRLNDADHTLVIKQGTREVTYHLASSAQLMQGARTLSAANLAGDVGQHARVRYTAVNGQMTVNRVEVSAPAPQEHAAGTVKSTAAKPAAGTPAHSK